MPRVKRCPKHSRRKPRKTGRCVYYNPPIKKSMIDVKMEHVMMVLEDLIPENCVNYNPTDRVKDGQDVKRN